MNLEARAITIHAYMNEEYMLSCLEGLILIRFNSGGEDRLEGPPRFSITELCIFSRDRTRSIWDPFSESEGFRPSKQKSMQGIEVQLRK